MKKVNIQVKVTYTVNMEVEVSEKLLTQNG